MSKFYSFILLALIISFTNVSCDPNIVFDPESQENVDDNTGDDTAPVEDVFCEQEPGETIEDLGFYFPLRVGNEWFYDIGLISYSFEMSDTETEEGITYYTDTSGRYYTDGEDYYIENDEALSLIVFDFVASGNTQKVLDFPMQINKCWEVVTQFEEDPPTPAITYRHIYKCEKLMDTMGSFEDVLVVALKITQEVNGQSASKYRRLYWAKGVGLIQVDVTNEDGSEVGDQMILSNYTIG